MDVVSAADFKALREKLALQGRIALRVVTGSMEPLIPVGTLIEVVSCVRELQPFDIIVFWDSNRLICHYIYSCNVLVPSDGPKTFGTRGMISQDVFPVASTKVRGLVVSHAIPWRVRLTYELKAAFCSVFGF